MFYFTQYLSNIYKYILITTTGGMSGECKRYHSRLAELIAAKKGEDYSTTMSWIRAKFSFAILQSALLCLRGTRAPRRITTNLQEMDFKVDNSRAKI